MILVSPADHLLVCPKTHIKNVKSLRGEEDALLVQRMKDIGSKALIKLGTIDDTLSAEGERVSSRRDIAPIYSIKHCFHVPPYNSIDHLHLHRYVMCSYVISVSTIP